MSGRPGGKRTLVTHADRYSGPPVIELFREEGAWVSADQSDYKKPDSVRDVVEGEGRTDILGANFAGPSEMMPLKSMLRDITDFEDRNRARVADGALRADGAAVDDLPQGRQDSRRDERDPASPRLGIYIEAHETSISRSPG